MEIGLLAIGAGLAVGLAGLATGYAQAHIGSAGAGTIAEKRHYQSIRKRETAPYNY